jgi:hypothetical protein
MFSSMKSANSASVSASVCCRLLTSKGMKPLKVPSSWSVWQPAQSELRIKSTPRSGSPPEELLLEDELLELDEEELELLDVEDALELLLDELLELEVDELELDEVELELLEVDELEDDELELLEPEEPPLEVDEEELELLDVEDALELLLDEELVLAEELELLDDDELLELEEDPPSTGQGSPGHQFLPTFTVCVR